MSRGPLAYLLQQVFKQILFDEAPKKASEPLMEENLTPSREHPSRRQFLLQGLAGLGAATGIITTNAYSAAANLYVPSFWDRLQTALPGASGQPMNPDASDSGNQAPRITIIGAGMAGLNCSYQLQKVGLKSTLYESSSRHGGRMFTAKGIFGKEITTDFGGEWVDDEHHDIRSLCQELSIELFDSRVKHLEKHTYYFEGKILSRQEIYEAIRPYAAVLKRDVDRLPAEITRANVGTLYDLDHLSIPEYLKTIGVDGWLHRFLILAMEGEYGAEAGLQSAINLLIILRPPQKIQDMDDFEGQGAEVMKIKGGSQALCEAITHQLEGAIHYDHTLAEVRPLGEGFTLTFTDHGISRTVETDYLVLTLPFSRLRGVHLALNLPATKKIAIQELAYGNSAKLILGFSGKPWVRIGHIGKVTTDLSFHAGWDSTLMQSETEASYTIYSGGKLSEKLRDGDPSALALEFLPALNQVFPGMDTSYTQIAKKFIWEEYPHSLGAYSYYQVGQWTRISGYESMPVGQLFFAGEHCSQLWQGYMNGAALSARLAAEKIQEKIQQKPVEKSPEKPVEKSPEKPVEKSLETIFQKIQQKPLQKRQERSHQNTQKTRMAAFDSSVHP